MTTPHWRFTRKDDGCLHLVCDTEPPPQRLINLSLCEDGRYKVRVDSLVDGKSVHHVKAHDYCQNLVI